MSAASTPSPRHSPLSHLRILFCGSGEFGLPTLPAIREAGHELALVVTQPERPAGRGRKLTPTPVAQFAIEQNLPLLRTANINSEQLPPADVMVVIAFGQKIAPHVIDHPRLGSVNLHGSILPKFRGAAPINAAIIAGETVTGNSIIRLAQKMDAGPILAQSRVEIGELETAGELHDRLGQDGAPLMLSVLDQLASGTAKETEQDHSQATLAPKLSREASKIDWNKAPEQIARQIRGMYPWPACHVQLMDGERVVDRLTLVRARTSEEQARASPGTILDNDAVAAGDRAIKIVELQPQGKRPMSLDAYRRGHRWHAGMRLESIV